MNPLASVVIATCRRPELLARCLEQLKAGAQTAAFESYEVIVADDDAAGSTLPILKEKHPWVRATKGPSLGPAGARNAAARLATGDLLIFTDDDCVPAATFVEAYLKKNKPVMRGPTTCTQGCKDPFETAPVNIDGAHDFSCNLACNRSLFSKLNGFDEKYLFYGFEDYDFFERVRRSGHTITFVPLAKVDHPPRKLSDAPRRVRTLENLFRYQLKHGRNPSLTMVLREIFSFWKGRLKLKVSTGRKLKAIGSMLMETILTLACFDEMVVRAQKGLCQ